jgi:hypothetical protein
VYAFNRGLVAAGETPTPRRLESEELMSDLTARLEALVRRYEAECDLQPPGADLGDLDEEFCSEIDVLVAHYGHSAVDKAIDSLPDARWPSVSLH